MNTMNPILKLYYTNRLVLFTVCCAEFFCYLGLYVFHFLKANPSEQVAGVPLYDVVYYIVCVSAPLNAFKQFTNLLQFKLAVDSMSDWEESNMTKMKKK